MQAASAAALATLVPGRKGEARPLPPTDLERLARDEVVRVHVDHEVEGVDYFGGIAYGVIHAPLLRVMDTLLDPPSYPHLLPMTLEARILGYRGGDMQLFLRQGKAIMNVSYVLRVRRESPGLLRFWLDQAQAHDIGDCFGYFRVQPWERGATLLTYAALLHLDFGPVKMLFAEKIRKYALGTPELVRAYVQAHGG